MVRAIRGTPIGMMPSIPFYNNRYTFFVGPGQFVEKRKGIVRINIYFDENSLCALFFHCLPT
jgi:hypothetical protein